ncbi:MAG TPA: SgcJ/EcaC family oxidoreductase [Bryobacteraceae bacterium]|nr:SgcJ/EcaC family oxidoreductase [Bryobacteraceae bacterium]
MRLIFVLCLVFSVGFTIRSASVPDSDAIRTTIAHYLQARNEKAPARLRTLFTEDADQLVSTGEWRHGLDELTAGMLSSSHQEQAKSSIEIASIRMLDAEVAIVDGRYQTTSLNGQVRQMWTTFIVKRTPAGWRITAIRNMKPAVP